MPERYRSDLMPLRVKNDFSGKVIGYNPIPATKLILLVKDLEGFFVWAAPQACFVLAKDMANTESVIRARYSDGNGNE
jgi:hypothetical protein